MNLIVRYVPTGCGFEIVAVCPSEKVYDILDRLKMENPDNTYDFYPVNYLEA